MRKNLEYYTEKFNNNKTEENFINILNEILSLTNQDIDYFKNLANIEIVTAGKEYINIGIGLMPTTEKQYIVKTENQRIVYENIKYQLDKMWNINN